MLDPAEFGVLLNCAEPEPTAAAASSDKVKQLRTALAMNDRLVS